MHISKMNIQQQKFLKRIIAIYFIIHIYNLIIYLKVFYQ